MKTNSFPDLAALKKSTDLVAVVQARGVKLVKRGADFVGCCPFHEEKEPSFHVTPSKNLFHCFGCGAGGSVIDFVMRKDGLTKQEALDWLCRHSGGAVRRAEASGVNERAAAMTESARAVLLKRVVAFYAKTLLQDRDGFDYLKQRKLDDPTMLEVFQVGYCNGTLNKALPGGGEIVEQLKAIGILNQHGRESFLGRVVVPIFDTAGNVVGLYGRRINDENPRHLYLKGEHRGVWNGACAKTNQSLFVTEAILDGMALWQAGFKNVIALYGTEGFTPDHERLLQDNGATEVFLCLDNDEPGQAATERLKEKLSALVKAVHVMAWPDGVKDAAEFFLGRSAADFEMLVKAANPKEDLSAVVRETGTEAEIAMTPEGFTVVYGVRRYELFAVEKPSPARLKATIKAMVDGRFHVDSVDFYLSRSRRAFIVEAARLFREVPEVVEMDVNRLIVQLESYVEKRLVESAPRITLVSEGDKAEAQRLGKSPDLAREILRDVGKLGVVGEQSNALMGYLAMTSRKMEDPLALLILSSSGAGKSHLQDTILSLCPEEDLVKVTSLSDRALFYKGEDSLKHKVLALEEEAGAMGADYAIRNLISSKKLVIETTIKNPLTGKMETQVNRVNGPTAVFKTTTNPETNAETRSRFFMTSVDESAEQTRAILAAQRQSHTLDGLLRKTQAAAIQSRHHALQRLLKPLHVVNPFEPLLTYGDDRLLIRRDNPKYLHLILAVTFLHQMQRPVKNHPELGDPSTGLGTSYIEATLDDIAIANDLALQLLGQSLDDLSSPSRRLLGQIAGHVREHQRPFSRRELREVFKWSDTRLRVHLAELVRLEYVLPVGGAPGKAFEYQLAVEPGELEAGRLFVPGLKSVEQVRKEAHQAYGKVNGKPNPAAVFGGVAAQNGGVAATPPPRNGGVPGDGFASEKRFCGSHPAAFWQVHIRGKKANGSRIPIKNEGCR
ncbi:MAG: CHC2 zinc finger domain-containing protein [Verrucomicrobiae bacterium]|nr:CHC2 zinc finger domain-containing protein [Verrucomicrobiae bacterium]